MIEQRCLVDLARSSLGEASEANTSAPDLTSSSFGVLHSRVISSSAASASSSLYREAELPAASTDAAAGAATAAGLIAPASRGRLDHDLDNPEGELVSEPEPEAPALDQSDEAACAAVPSRAALLKQKEEVQRRNRSIIARVRQNERAAREQLAQSARTGSVHPEQALELPRVLPTWIQDAHETHGPMRFLGGILFCTSCGALSSTAIVGTASRLGQQCPRSAAKGSKSLISRMCRGLLPYHLRSWPDERQSREEPRRDWVSVHFSTSLDRWVVGASLEASRPEASGPL